MHDISKLLVSRATRVLNEKIYPNISQDIASATIYSWDVPDEPVSFEEAMKHDFLPFNQGRTWGPVWGTTWFRLEVDIPHDIDQELYDVEIHVDLGWENHSPGFQAEGLVYRTDGSIIKAVNPRNSYIPVPHGHQGKYIIFIEAAANPLLLGIPPFQRTLDGDKTTASREHIYTFRRASLVLVSRQITALRFDVETILGLAQELQEGTTEHIRVVNTLNSSLDLLKFEDLENSAAAAREILQELYTDYPTQHAHKIIAVGHAHIDTGWLWPLRETRRKVVRTLSNVLHLLDSGAHMYFALPAAQHVAWLEEDSPETFTRLCHWVKEGRIIPVGGMWVEPDAMLPSGESLSRQMLYGQLYFEEKFGKKCTGIWLPDSFGYCASLPQIGVLGGAEWFLTQKISWNQTDVFPHHTLWWEGIDGTRIFTHFPPVDTYGAEITQAQTHHAARNFKDKGNASISMMPYGYGDGGGGPVRQMLERAKRQENLVYSPSVVHGDPEKFFEEAHKDYENPPTWVGELYLELHRGTSTTQANTKKANRLYERFFRDVELLAATAALRTEYEYPVEKFRSLWHLLLTLQFHDILPGTSIAWVYQEMERDCALIKQGLEEIRDSALEALQGSQPVPVLLNTSYHGCILPALGWIPADNHEDDGEKNYSITADSDGWVVNTEKICAHINNKGHIVSMKLRDHKEREIIPTGYPLGALWLYQDFPNMWDAWDIDEFYRGTGEELQATNVYVQDESIIAEYDFLGSRGSVVYSVDQGFIKITVNMDWHTREHLLKMMFPLDIHTDNATYEIQSGYMRRAIHENTTWESNKFEVAAQRWVHIADGAFGIGIVNEATYGWSHSRLRSYDRPGVCAQLEASILRSPVFPDPYADEGTHSRSFWIVPDTDYEHITQWADSLGHEYIQTSIDAAYKPVINSVEGITVDAVKMAEDGSGDLIIRGHEYKGAAEKGSISLNIDAHLSNVEAVNLLEKEKDTLVKDLHWYQENGVLHIDFSLHAFQILTIRIEGVSCSSE